MSISPLRILLVEDDELFRLGLRVRLQMESGLEIVAEAEDGETAVEILRHQSVDLVLLDVGLPGIGAVEACRQIKQLYPHLPILVLTSHTQEFLINRMINSGVQGYCLKGIASETLLLAIRSLAAGASWWDKNATPKLQAAFAEHPPILPEEVNTESSPLLTRREQEILALIAQGQSNREIAEKLYITHGTVRVHVHAILHKLKVRDRTQAALLAIQRQLIEQDLIGSLPNS